MAGRTSIFFGVCCVFVVGCSEGSQGHDRAPLDLSVGGPCVSGCGPVDLGSRDASLDQAVETPPDLPSASLDLRPSTDDLAQPIADLAHPDLVTVKMCVPTCTTHEQCASSCATPHEGRSCCDVTANACFTSTNVACPEPSDLGVIGPY
jgi:hypothetical protein